MDYSIFKKIIEEVIKDSVPKVETELIKKILKEPLSFEEKLGVLYLLGNNKLSEKILNLIKSIRDFQQRKISSSIFISFLQKEFNFSESKAEQFLKELLKEPSLKQEIYKEEEVERKEMKDIYREPIE